MSVRDKPQLEDLVATPLDRRGFLKALLATGAVAAVPGGLLKPLGAGAAAETGATQVFRNACPRNCYDTCGIVTYVRDGVVQYIEGAPESTFTAGGLCVKGYSYPSRTYSPDRIKYPMVQQGRGSGNWKRVSWDEAIDRIARKILEIKERDGSLLGLALDKYSGNFGITHYGVEGMMSSLGYTTRFVGTPCWPAGIDAQNYDMGDMWCNDPEDLADSAYIIVWGANPAWCSVHSMKFLYEAQRKGAKLVVIDPVLTQTAAKADLYVRVRTSTDGALALGMARHILDEGLYDRGFVDRHSVGFDDFAAYLRDRVTVKWAQEQSGVPAPVIRQLAREFATAKPATIWLGYGLQRHVNGGHTVRAIDALVAMTGNIGQPGGGARYGHLRTWGFNYHAMVMEKPAGSKGWLGPAGPKGEFDFAGEEKAEYTDRAVNLNKIAQEILDADNPPIRMLWVACKNPFSQDFNRPLLEKAWDKLEMVVVADQFFNHTVDQADLVLPVTTIFEEYTVNVSYWHYWISLNEQAIQPMYECLSDVQIGARLSKRLNELAPGSCTFPTEMDTKVWMEKEFNQGIYDLFGIASWEDLRQGPAKAKLPSPASWHDRKFATPSGKYEFRSDLAADYGHRALPEYVEPRRASGRYRLLTPHSRFNIHSQFQNLDHMMDFSPEPYVYVHPETAAANGIGDLDPVRVFNAQGEVRLRAKLSDVVAPDTLLMYEAWYKNSEFNVENVVDDASSDMGAYKTGAPGVAIHDQWADIARA
ncbi:MAG: molybdopterin-dependent oxidoreductase [Deferrisomatales bacterium]